MEDGGLQVSVLNSVESLCKITSTLAKSSKSLSNFLVHSVTPLGQQGLLKSISLFLVGDIDSAVRSRAL